MVPSAPGNYTSRDQTFREPDWHRIWTEVQDSVRATQAWTQAKENLQYYLDVRRIKPTGLWLHMIEEQYLRPLLELFISETQSLSYERVAARRVILAMLRELDDPIVKLQALVALEGFKSTRPVKLDHELSVRPISQDELLWLGRVDQPWAMGLTSEHIPHIDWWICEIRVVNPRGTAIGWNRVHPLTELLAFGLRAFKSGGIRLGIATVHQLGHFGHSGHTWGGRIEPLAVGHNLYELAAPEIPRFVKFWRGFKRLMEQDRHYLQLPVRRLRAAGTRREQEDALVDYVVGLEALLGKGDERTELAYRFRIRGSVVLATRKTERKQHLKALEDLYNLRSRIVHGQHVRRDNLAAALPVAEEALRKVWRWYFTHWQTSKDNHAAIQRIDEQLLVG